MPPPHPAAARAALPALLLEAALLLCWSGGFVGVRFANDYAPIFSILLWRSLVSGLLLLPWALTRGPRLCWAGVRSQLTQGALAMAAYLGSFAYAIANGVPTGVVALITDMLPLVVALLSWPVLGQALRPRQWWGSGLGLLGVLLASGVGTGGGTAPAWAYALPVAGTVALALATLHPVPRAQAMPIHQQLCIQCLGAAAIFALPAWREGGWLPTASVGFVAGILWLALVATFGAWGLYYLALRRSAAARVTVVLYLSPPVTMVWAWLMFGEPLSWAMALGFMVSLAGIVLFARARTSGA